MRLNIERKNMYLPIMAVFILALFFSLVFSNNSSAASLANFNAGHIIDDSVFTHSGSMNADQIQAFLNSKVPTCDTYGTQVSEFGGGTRAEWAAAHGYSTPFTCLKDYSENGLTAAQIIYNTSQQYQINPQVLIVLLQKEQALITDTWPTSNQYRSATGYGCPDDAPCESTYYGFTNQVTWAARTFRGFINGSYPWANYVVGNNYIQYNPTASCGGSTVNIVNRSTQALYNYTPYQPNQASLDAGYGNATCGAYGNRNFFLYFTDWFGSTFNEINLQKGSGATIYVVYDGIKQGIQSLDVLYAWGLDKLPVYTVSDVALDAIPDGGTLTRLVKNPNNPDMLLLADKGGFYNAWPSSISNFGIDPSSASTIGARLLSLASWSADLSPFIQSASSGGGVLLIDNGTYHVFSSWDNLVSWAGNNPRIITISDSLLSTMTASPNYGIFSGQIIDTDGNRYLLDNGSAAPLLDSLKTNYPQDNQILVSKTLISILPKTSAVSQFVKTSNENTIYLINGGKKLGFISADIFSNFIASSKQKNITYLSKTTLNSIDDGSTIYSRFIYNSDNPTNGYYLLNSKAQTLAASFMASSYGVPLNTDTIASLDISSTNIYCGSSTGFIKASGASTIFMLENGTKRPIANLRNFYLLNDSGSICEISAADANTIPDGPIVTPFVQYNGNYYLLESGKYYLTDLETLTNIGVSSTTQISEQIFNTFTDGGTLNMSSVINGRYTLINNGKYYTTTNATIAKLWNISSQTHTEYLIQELSNGGALDQYAVSSNPNDGTVYLIDNNVFHGITDSNSFINSGAIGKNIVQINSSYIADRRGSNWQGYLAKDSSNVIWVLDCGKKRKITSSAQADWTYGHSPLTLSDDYLSILPQGTDLTYSVNEPNSFTIFAIDAGKKRGIPTLSKYVGTKYYPSSAVSKYLFDSIPDGSVL